MTKHSAGSRPTGRRIGRLATDLGLSTATVYRAIKANKLRAARLGSAFIITDEAASEWLDAATARPEAQA